MTENKRIDEIAGKESENHRYSTLLFRSTGLGKTVLEGEPVDIQVVDDTVILHIQSTAPVRWRIRAAMTYKGLLKTLKLALRWSILKFLIWGPFTIKKPKLPEEF